MKAQLIKLVVLFFYTTMKNQRKYLIIAITFLVTLFVSCKSTEQNIYTMSQESGQLVFLRQVTVDNKAFPLRNSAFDMTVKIIDFELTDNNIVNYTLYFPQKYYSYIEKSELFFVTPSIEKIALQDCKVLYKDFDKQQNLEVRFTATISKEDVKALLEDPAMVQIGITLDTQTQLFSSPDFSQKLYELGVLVK